MASGELVYLPVLNFLQFSRNNGVDDDLIIRHALEFSDAAAVAAAKSALWNKVLPGEICPRPAGNKATQSHLRDILELLAKCDSEDLTVPTYVILSANEVPSVLDLTFSHLSSKLTRMEKVLNAVASRAEVYDNHFPPLPQPIEPNALATIVVTKIPASLDNPIKRKEMLDKVTGHECVCSAKAKKRPTDLALVVEELELTPTQYRPSESPQKLAEMTGFTPKQIKEMYRAFKSECPSGVVTEAKFAEAFSKFYPTTDSTLFAQYVFLTLDPTCSGSATFGAYLQLLAVLLRGSAQERLNWTFKYVSMKEFPFLKRK
ncbi:hypothetical protein QYM36_011608 [Artemia franciscana]|uniref:Uncharacterized protein n=1 Tax=Artemia franciscana TaxID=6661 RepID=A0AA88KZ35_ARTSF|nr:hypothetical protein QYM36_011608 [Artemia franciscana]